MALTYDQNTTPYLTPRLEFDQLNQPTSQGFVGGTDIALGTGDLEPKYRTTGNGLIFLEGQILTTGAISQDAIILTLPDEIGRNAAAIKLVGQSIDAGGISATFDLTLTGNAITVTEQAGIADTTTIILSNIIYFTG